jgi:hypothetical protein
VFLGQVSPNPPNRIKIPPHLVQSRDHEDFRAANSADILIQKRIYKISFCFWRSITLGFFFGPGRPSAEQCALRGQLQSFDKSFDYGGAFPKLLGVNTHLNNTYRYANSIDRFGLSLNISRSKTLSPGVRDFL